MPTYSEFFEEVTGGLAPYPYQNRLGEMPWPDTLEIPTGLGKTAAITVAWIWKRGWGRGDPRGAPDPTTPRRLVWCLPMRVLVEQTARTVEDFLQRSDAWGLPGSGRVSVHTLMGGEGDLKTWAEYPEEDMILVGTQDMLLSRALMRGWGLSRFQWPIHFALLHNDCLWAFDEVQLMGPGLTTSAQLEAFRRTIGLAKPSRSLWLSATLNMGWLATVDFEEQAKKLERVTVSEADRTLASDRIGAVKHLRKAKTTLNRLTSAKNSKAYLDALTAEILDAHDPRAQTLVIVNRVDRAQELFRRVAKARPKSRDILLHARFRPMERVEIERRLREEDTGDRIIVATQAIEAGIDLTSSLLFTELAPWSSLVQRFGRCNRYGEMNAVGGAEVRWIDIEEDADGLPYDHGTLSESRLQLDQLSDVGPSSLPATRGPRPLTATLRKKDLIDLFNTDPDLSGFDVDVSDFIRDTGPPDVRVFWRGFEDSPNEPDVQPPPRRSELCRVSIHQAKYLETSKGWIWDNLASKWKPAQGSIRPGVTLLLNSRAGGYDQVLGFRPKSKKAVAVLESLPAEVESMRFGGDWRSTTRISVGLSEHLSHVATEADRLCRAVDEVDALKPVVQAARWHDVGKAHPVFQASMHRCPEAPAGMLAKSPCQGPMRHKRQYFRHELASMLAWLSHRGGANGQEADEDLVAYLIAAHHGKVRMSLRAMPGEKAPDTVPRFARGIWEGDELPPLTFDGETSRECRLSLGVMELGLGGQGRSWTERTQELIGRHGVFRLAWMETLVRLADWRASAMEQETAPSE